MNEHKGSPRKLARKVLRSQPDSRPRKQSLVWTGMGDDGGELQRDATRTKRRETEHTRCLTDL